MRLVFFSSVVYAGARQFAPAWINPECVVWVRDADRSYNPSHPEDDGNEAEVMLLGRGQESPVVIRGMTAQQVVEELTVMGAKR